MGLPMSPAYGLLTTGVFVIPPLGLLTGVVVPLPLAVPFELEPLLFPEPLPLDEPLLVVDVDCPEEQANVSSPRVQSEIQATRRSDRRSKQIDIRDDSG